jgi:opacity protein-like surface antigen
MKKLLFAAVAVFLASSPALAAGNCGTDHQHAYEQGVSDGRADGSHLLDFNPLRHGRKVALKWNNRGECYRQGYEIGYGNASADARKKPSKPTHDNAPTPGSNERAYYDDGCHEGTTDAQASMSMAYERHSDMYDRRFEPYFRDGYEHCWKMFR